MRLPKTIPSKWFFGTNDGLFLRIQGKLSTKNTGIGTKKEVEDAFGKNPNLTVKESKTKKIIIRNELEKLKNEKVDKHNGVLGGIPILIKSTSRSYSNSIAKQLTFSNKEFIDSINKQPFKIKLVIIVFGREVLEELKKIVELSKKKEVITFTDNKANATYNPLVITNLSYSEDYKVQNAYEVSIDLEEVRILDKKNNGVKVADGTYKRTEKVKIVDTKPSRPKIKQIYTSDYSEYRILKEKHRYDKDTHIIMQVRNDEKIKQKNILKKEIKNKVIYTTDYSEYRILKEKYRLDKNTSIMMRNKYGGGINWFPRP